MPVSDYQLAIGDLVLGPGTDYIVHEIDGFGAPIERNGDTDRPRDHGAFYGLDYLGSRVLTITATVRGATPSEVVDNVDALLAEWQPISEDPEETKPLSFAFPGHDWREFRGRPRRAKVTTARIIGNRAPVVLEYVAADPRQYGEESTASIGMASVSSGRAYPRTYDVTYGGGTSGFLDVENVGNFATRPVFTLHGPAANPSIEEVVSGLRMDFAITLAADEFLVIDTDARTVMLNGTASRYNTLVSGSRFIELAPGLSQIRFSADTFQGAASLDVTSSPAWL